MNTLIDTSTWTVNTTSFSSLHDEEFVAEDVGSQNSSQQSEEALESRQDSSEAEGGIESWDGEMGDGKRIAAEDQAEENGCTVLGGNSTEGKSKRTPKHS